MIASQPEPRPPLLDARRPGPWLLGALGVLVLGALTAEVVPVRSLVVLGGVLTVLAALGFVVWRSDPAASFTAALLLAPLSGNWDGLGVPGILSLNRIVLAIAVAAVLLRGASSLGRPPLRMHATHWLMLAVATYAVTSAVVSGTMGSNASIAGIAERLGILPFLAFLAAPVAFRTEHDRGILLVALVAFGAYLGLTALFETIDLRSLVFPRYINNPNFGILPDRARGPFVEPAQNALAMFTCAGACVIAMTKWRSNWTKGLAGLIALLCLAGVLFTLTRAAWIGAAAGIVVTVLVVPRLRARAIPLLGLAALTVALALVLVPDLSEKTTERRTHQGTIYDRFALNRAALNMLEARPLLGFGWGEYYTHNRDYLQLEPNTPLPRNIANQPVHNLYLGLAAELGLLGTTLWILAVGLAVGGALLRRGPPEVQPWRWLLLGVTAFYLSISNFEPTTTFSTLLLLLMAGVVNGGAPQWAFLPKESATAASSAPARDPRGTRS